MSRKRGPPPKIKTGTKRLGVVASNMPIELTPEQSSQVLQILNLDKDSPFAARTIKEFSCTCAMATSARLIYEKTRPTRSYAQSRLPGQRGIPARHYRAVLASDLAQLMLGLKLEPKIIRLDPWEDTMGACFHRLFKLALEVSGDRPLSDSVRVRYLSRGLAIERNPPLDEISPLGPG